MLFFQNCPVYLSGVVFTILFFLVTVLILTLTKEMKVCDVREFTLKIGGTRVANVYTFLFSLNFFLSATAMLAGANSVLNLLFCVECSFPWFGLLTAMLAGVITYKGIDGLKAVNFLAVPLIAVFIFLLAFRTKNYLPFASELRLFPTITEASVYISMNAMMMCGVLISVGKNVTQKEIWFSSFVASVLLGLLVFAVLYATRNLDFKNIEMPLVFLASEGSFFLYSFGLIVVYLAIFTTLLSGVYPLQTTLNKKIKDKAFSNVVILGFAFALSSFGFRKIVDFFYRKRTSKSRRCAAMKTVETLSDGESVVAVGHALFQKGNKEVH